MDSQSPVPSLSLEFSQILAIPRLRRFLAPHAEGSWAEIVKLTLLYGVLALDQCYGRDELSLQEIRQEVERGKGTGEVLQRLPRIRSGVEKLREDLEWIARELDGDQGLAPEVSEPLCLPAPETTDVGANTQSTTEASCNVLKIEHREREPDAFEAQGIYPSWWGDGSSFSAPECSFNGERLPKDDEENERPVPRGSYTCQHNDVPTANSDPVPPGLSCQHLTSGFESAKSELDALFETMGISEDSVENMQSHCRIQTTGQQLICSTTNGDSTESKALLPSWKSKLSATEIADSILSNPWTSAFLEPSNDGASTYFDELTVKQHNPGRVPTQNDRIGDLALEDLEVPSLTDGKDVPKQKHDIFKGIIDRSGYKSQVAQEPSGIKLIGGRHPRSKHTNQSELHNDETENDSGPPNGRGCKYQKEAWVMDFGHLKAHAKKNGELGRHKDVMGYLRRTGLYYE